MKKSTVLSLIVASTLVFSCSTKNPYKDVEYNKSDIPKFSKMKLNFKHKFNEEKMMPFMGSAIIDINNDGVEEVFLGGGYNQNDAIFQYNGEKFVDITETTSWKKSNMLEATYGVAVIDADNDGDSDLFVARESGVYLYTNKRGKFYSKKIRIKFDSKSIPLSIALGDINKDGKVDMFVSTYLKMSEVKGQSILADKNYGAKSMMLLNNGNNTFTDITKSSGLYKTKNALQATFIDLDNDKMLDLAVAYDAGHVATYRNMGNLKFKALKNPNSKEFSYPMGIAVGDYNNNSSPDLFFSNIGYSIPLGMARGDLKETQVLNEKWMLFKNKGDFGFVNVAEQTKVADYGFSWGAVFEDFNLDGRQDLVVSQNYVKFPPHKFSKLPGRLLMQNEMGQFVAIEKKAGAVNKAYSITPLVADFNRDGYPDLIHVNLDGKSNAFMNKAENFNNHIRVILPNDAKSLGAKITVKTNSGKQYTSWMVNSEGLMSDQTHVVTFGLAKEKNVKYIKVEYMDGTTEMKENPKVNRTVAF